MMTTPDAWYYLVRCIREDSAAAQAVCGTALPPLRAFSFGCMMDKTSVVESYVVS
jgi:hypothetical protein